MRKVKDLGQRLLHYIDLYKGQGRVKALGVMYVRVLRGHTNGYLEVPGGCRLGNYGYPK